MIELKNICFSYASEASSRAVLNNFSLYIVKGDIIALTGESGIGKTTVMRLLLGLEKPAKGEIIGLDGIRISAVYQENRLFPWYTVRKNVLLPAQNEPDAAAKADHILSALGLSEYQDKYPSELSGGQQRRVAVARALLFGGDLLILDEPFTGLDAELKKKTASLIRECFDTVLIITHDETEVGLLGCNKSVSL